MSLFLFAKQIVDMLYQFQILDYIMVVSVVVMLCYQIVLVHSSPKNLVKMDYLVLALAGFALIAYFMTPADYKTFFKVLSAYLIYFVGRVYWERIEECHSAVVASSYLVIWANLLHRIIRYRGLFGGMDNHGEFYYFKTDLTFAMLLGVAFIVIWGRDRILKWVTFIFVVPYMTLYSLSRNGWAMLVPVYFLLLLYLREKKTGVPLRFSKKLILAILLAVLMTFLLGVSFYAVMLLGSGGLTLESFEKNMMQTRGLLHTRGEIWPLLLNDLNSAPLFHRLFGMGWGMDTELLIEMMATEAHSLYFKLLYCTGYLGFLCFGVFEASLLWVMKGIRNRELFYLILAAHFLFLGYGIGYSTIASTQMSWFAFLLAGMLVSCRIAQDKEEL